MRPQRLLAPREATEIFDQAVAENALAVVTLQQDGDWKAFKCRFLERDPNQKFFVLDYQSVNGEPLPDLAAGQFVGVGFRHKNRKILFATVIEAKGRFVLENQTGVAAIRYRWPDAVTELQRRAYLRTAIPDGTTITACLWAGGGAARATAHESGPQAISGRLCDLSCGGTLIRLDHSVPPTWKENETLGAQLWLSDARTPVLVDAFYRGTRPDPQGNLCVAIQFVGLELSIDGRLVLQRLVRCVQKFHRTAMSSTMRTGNERFQGDS